LTTINNKPLERAFSASSGCSTACPVWGVQCGVLRGAAAHRPCGAAPLSPDSSISVSTAALPGAPPADRGGAFLWRGQPAPSGGAPPPAGGAPGRDPGYLGSSWGPRPCLPCQRSRAGALGQRLAEPSPLVRREHGEGRPKPQERRLPRKNAPESDRNTGFVG